MSKKTTLKQGIRIKRMIGEYTEKLREAKIQTIGTEVKVIPTKKAGEMKVLRIQKFVS